MSVTRLPVRTIAQHKRQATLEAQRQGHVFKGRWKAYHGAGMVAYERHCSQCDALLRIESRGPFSDRGDPPIAMGANLTPCEK